MKVNQNEVWSVKKYRPKSTVAAVTLIFNAVLGVTMIAKTSLLGGLSV